METEVEARKKGFQPGHTGFSKTSSKLFLVQGTAQVNGGATSEQDRLVHAESLDQALQKYQQYWTDLSTPGSVYTVVSARASEAIR